MASLINQRAAKVELIVFDVDGVLTRGEIIYSAEGEWKIFTTQDGLGFNLCRKAGIKIALLSGRESEAVRRRAEELGVDFYTEGAIDKGVALKEMQEKAGYEPGQVCYVGDDLPDIPAL
ncbi:MAG: HAD-IIIA family hydrolase, partial [Lentisphaerota bacterium]